MIDGDLRPLFAEVLDMISNSLPRLLELRQPVRWKDDGSPVTKADILVQDLFERFLSDRLPSSALLSEESFEAGSWQDSDLIAILDPIDGTENFCSGLPEWGISFGLWRRGAHLGSLVFFPELGKRLLTGDRPSLFTSRIRGFSSSMSEAIATEVRAGGELRITGCAAYNLYNVALGVFASFSNPKGAYVWDLLPGLMLAIEHGCSVTVDGENYSGKLLDPSRRHRVHVQHRHDFHPR